MKHSGRFATKITTAMTIDLTSVNYGYLWWNNYGGRDSVFKATGFARQFIYIVPARNMVIVTNGNDNVTGDQSNVNEAVIIGIAKKYFF
ncbi:MAG: hypothetical protein HW389_2906 [Bacteroidetes bacterium]|nr:hypothetical protein [Bacteroidota bacterium]